MPMFPIAYLQTYSGPQEEAYIRSAALPVARLLVLGPHGSPGYTVAPDANWMAGWARAAREHDRRIAQSIASPRIHLFMSAPAPAVLMLGHQWNLMTPTTLYEFTKSSYAPTMIVK